MKRWTRCKPGVGVYKFRIATIYCCPVFGDVFRKIWIKWLIYKFLSLLKGFNSFQSKFSFFDSAKNTCNSFTIVGIPFPIHFLFPALRWPWIQWIYCPYALQKYYKLLKQNITNGYQNWQRFRGSKIMHSQFHICLWMSSLLL